MTRTFDAIERTAKALYGSMQEHQFADSAFDVWGDLTNERKDALREVAKAALKAYHGTVIEVPTAVLGAKGE